MMLHKNPLSIL